MEKAGEIAETGRVLAQLDDWRAITFILVLVIFFLLIERYLTQRDMRLERSSMMQLAKQFAENSGKVAEAIATLRLEFISLRFNTNTNANAGTELDHNTNPHASNPYFAYYGG